MATRYARVDLGDDLTRVDQARVDQARVIQGYLPSGYRVAAIVISRPNYVLITGEDYAGWTLDGYVIPRLASGMIFAREIEKPDICQ